MNVLPILFFVACTLLTAIRIHFGVDIADEAYYAAVNYRYFLGDRPFVDEINLTQSSFFLLKPLYNLFFMLQGSATGVILFGRFLYLAMVVFTGVVVIKTLPRSISKTARVACGCAVVLLIPQNIPSMSYNSMALCLITLTSCFLLSEVHATSAAISSALLFVVYPPMVLLAPLILLIGRNIRKTLLIWFVVGGLFLWSAGFENLLTGLKYTGHDDAEPGKLISLAWSATQILLLSGVGACIVYFLRRYKRMDLFLVVASCALPLFLFEKPRWVGSLLFITEFGLCLPLFLTATKTKFSFNGGLEKMWLLGMAGGFITAYSSHNWFVSFGIGFFPAFIVALILYSRIVPQFAVVLVLGVLGTYQYAMFREDPLKYLDHKVAWGPFKGLRTTKAKDDFIRNLSYVIQANEKPNTNIVFYDFFPAGYLLTQMRPAAPSAFRCALRSTDCLDLIDARSSGKTLGVRMKLWPESFEAKATPPYGEMKDFHRLFSENSTVVSSQDAFDILLRTKP